ncbi:uncharacterized protein QYS62_011335 [Fusarium acuminatum]|uniref:Uncharacterized protein n=1 Tax=Fusarium acuminatum TaxID=5515 RepID=A0ABZ2XAN7_9HYPO
MANLHPRAPPSPSTPDKIAIPEPFNHSSRVVCRQLRQIHKACGQWPWEFLPGRIPEVLDKDMLEPLVTAVQFTSDVEYSVSLSELTEWLMGRETDWILTSTHAADALNWVLYTHNKRASRSRSSHRGNNKTNKVSPRIRKRQHSNEEVTLPQLPHPDPQSQQKKRGAKTRSSTTHSMAKADAEAQYEFQTEALSKLESEPESEPEPEPEPEPELEFEHELDHGMEMDMDADNSNINGNAVEDTNLNKKLSENDNEMPNEAIAASSHRLQMARDKVKEYEGYLETEKKAFEVIRASLSEASEAHEAAIQRWRDAVVKADTKQYELKQFQNLSKSFSPDTQAALEQHSQSLQHLHDHAIEAEKHAEEKLRMHRREFCILEETRDVKEGTIKKISARIRRYQDEVDAEELKSPACVVAYSIPRAVPVTVNADTELRRMDPGGGRATLRLAAQ